MGIDHARDGAIPQRVIDQSQSSRSCLLTEQRVYNDPASIAPDDRHDREVIPANLIDPIHDFKQAMFGVQTLLPPKRWIHCVGAVPVNEVPTADLPNDITIDVGDRVLFQLRQQTARCVNKIGSVFQRQAVSHSRICCAGRIRRLALRRSLGDGLRNIRLCARRTGHQQDGCSHTK